MTRAQVTAIVVTYQTGPRLRECVYALSTDPELAAVIIVNNGNPPAMSDWLSQFADRRGHIQLIDAGGNIGFGAAVNLGARDAGTEQILVINPDAVLRRGSIGSMQAAAQGVKAPWIIGGRIFNTHGKEERGPRRRELTLTRALAYSFGLNIWTLEAERPPTGPVPMPVVSGAFFLTSKTSFERLDGFDESYFLHFEDVDLCKRCCDAGGSVIYDPASGALHYGATSDAPARVIKGHKADSFAYYLKTHTKGWFARALVAVISPMIGKSN